MKNILHVFSGTFESQEEACMYSEEQWEQPAPDDSWPDDQYAAWEERNPSWKLRKDLAAGYMDSDFIETIFGANARILNYLDTQLVSDEDRRKVRALIPPAANTLVLIMSLAFDGKDVSLSSTPQLHYHGQHVCNVGDE